MVLAVSDACQVPSEFLHHFPALAPEMFFKYQFTVPDVTPEPLVLSIIVKDLGDVDPACCVLKSFIKQLRKYFAALYSRAKEIPC